MFMTAITVSLKLFPNLHAIDHDTCRLFMPLVTNPIFQTEHALIHGEKLNMWLLRDTLHFTIIPRLCIPGLFIKKVPTSINLILSNLHTKPMKNPSITQHSQPLFTVLTGVQVLDRTIRTTRRANDNKFGVFSAWSQRALGLAPLFPAGRVQYECHMRVPSSSQNMKPLR